MIQPLLLAPTFQLYANSLQFSFPRAKCKEAIGVNLTLDQVERLNDKEVVKYQKRYEAYVGAKTTETLIESFLSLTTKALGLVVKIDDADALKNELKNDFIITKDMSEMSGRLALRFGSALAVVNAFLIAAKHVDFSSDEVTVTEQSSVTTQELVSNTE